MALCSTYAFDGCFENLIKYVAFGLGHWGLPFQARDVEYAFPVHPRINFFFFFKSMVPLVQFPAEYHETCAVEKAVVRNRGKYWKDRFQIFMWKNSAFHFSGSWGEGGLYTRWGFDPEFSAWKSYFEQWLSCRASGNVLTIPRLYVGGCIPPRIRDGYMEMTGYAVLQPDSWLGFDSEELVTYCRSSPSRWESSTRGETLLSAEWKSHHSMVGMR